MVTLVMSSIQLNICVGHLLPPKGNGNGMPRLRSRRAEGRHRGSTCHLGPELAVGPPIRDRLQPLASLLVTTSMLRGPWHALPDAQLDQALMARLDFMVFAGFEPWGAIFRSHHDLAQ